MGVDLVRAVEGDVHHRIVVQRRQRHTAALGLAGRGLGCGDAGDAFQPALGQQRADAPHDVDGRAARAQPDDHARRHQRHRPLGRLPLQFLGHTSYS